jgi:hypothetical protein
MQPPKRVPLAWWIGFGCCFASMTIGYVLG